MLLNANTERAGRWYGWRARCREKAYPGENAYRLCFGESDGLPFFTMPFVDGQSLQQRIQQAGPMPVPSN